jgi:hypothetical protein
LTTEIRGLAVSKKKASEFDKFIARWKKSDAAERLIFQLFMTEFCDALVEGIVS